MKAKEEDIALRPLVYTGWTFYLIGAIFLALVGWFIYAWWIQLTNGLVVTGLRDWGMPLEGSPWGAYIANFVWFVGIAHGGIAVSGVVRLLKLKNFRSIGRIAELLTIVTLIMAGASIVIDLGRPDRVFNMILYYSERIGQSPLVWDFTVVILYFALSASYLYLTMREDLAALKEEFPRRWRWLYRPMLIGYTPNEKPKVEQMAWWLAICLLALVAMLSGGVIPWLFGLQGSQAGYFGAVQGPYFLTGALASAIAGVIVVAAVLRRAYDWKEQIKPEVFRGLGFALAVFLTVYLWFVLHEHLTMRYAAPIAEFQISEALLTGRFAPAFWTILVIGFVMPAAYLFIQGFRTGAFRVWAIVLSAAVVVIAFWLKRLLIVIPSLLYPRLPYLPGNYSPTWIEWSIVVGTVASACLMYMAFIKLFPMMELRSNSNE